MSSVHFGFAHCNLCFVARYGLLCLLQARQCFVALCLQALQLHARQRLPCLDESAFGYQHLVQAARQLGGYVYFSGFNTAIAAGKACYFVAVVQLFPCAIANQGGGQQDGKGSEFFDLRGDVHARVSCKVAINVLSRSIHVVCQGAAVTTGAGALAGADAARLPPPSAAYSVTCAASCARWV